MDGHHRNQVLTRAINTIKQRHQIHSSSHSACLAGEAHWAKKQQHASIKIWANHTSRINRNREIIGGGNSSSSSSSSSTVQRHLCNSPLIHSSASPLSTAAIALNCLRMSQALRGLRRKPLRVRAAHVIASRRRHAQIRWVFQNWQSRILETQAVRRQRDSEMEAVAVWHWAQRREV